MTKRKLEQEETKAPKKAKIDVEELMLLARQVRGFKAWQAAMIEKMRQINTQRKNWGKIPLHQKTNEMYELSKEASDLLKQTLLKLFPDEKTDNFWLHLDYFQKKVQQEQFNPERVVQEEAALTLLEKVSEKYRELLL